MCTNIKKHGWIIKEIEMKSLAEAKPHLGNYCLGRIFQLKQKKIQDYKKIICRSGKKVSQSLGKSGKILQKPPWASIIIDKTKIITLVNQLYIILRCNKILVMAFFQTSNYS